MSEPLSSTPRGSKLWLTEYFALKTLDILSTGTTKRAMENPASLIDEEAIATWTSLQMTWFEWLNGLALTDEQREFICEWLVNLVDYDTDEAVTQFAAWLEWVKGD